MKYDWNMAPDHRVNGSYRWQQPSDRDDIIGMDTADMDFPCPSCLQDTLQSVWQDNTFNYRGIPDTYYDAVIGWYQRVYNFQVKRPWLSNAPGTIGAIRIALDLYGKPGGKILMQTPYFSPLKRAIDGSGHRIILNPMVQKNGRFELDLNDFEKKINQEHPDIFLMVNPHNPTGRVFSPEELEKMVEICRNNQVVIISDEVHSLVTYDDYRHTPILSVSDAARQTAVQVVSVSKGFNMMGLPHAIVMIADPDKKARWDQCMTSYSYSYAYNAFSIAGVTSVLSGQADEWLKELTVQLQRNRDILAEALRQKSIIPYLPDAGYLLWADCSQTGIVPEKLDQVFFDQAGIRLNNGLDHGEEGRGFVRVNFALTPDHLKEAIRRIQTIG